MKQITIRFHFLLLFFSLACWQCHPLAPRTGGASSIPATALKPFGRTVVNGNKNLELISSASQVGFRFYGKECRVVASVPSWPNHNYLQYEVDGVYQKRVRISSKEGESIVITAPSAGEHTVWLYKATEAHTGSVIIHRIEGNKVEVLARPQAPVIEFIGNSITCGAAADPSEVPCGSGVYHDQHNAYMAYGPRVARAVGANYLLSSVSGIGVYRNWNSDGPAMPQVYEKLDFRETTIPLWDFRQHAPHIVSIALGTNDFSRGDGQKLRQPFDSAKFVNSYISFVGLVKKKYPAAQILLLDSPMVGGEAGVLFQNCLKAVKMAIDSKANLATKSVVLFFFQPLEAHGCTGHPSVADHALMAEQLVPIMKKLLP